MTYAHSAVIFATTSNVVRSHEKKTANYVLHMKQKECDYAIHSMQKNSSAETTQKKQKCPYLSNVAHDLHYTVKPCWGFVERSDDNAGFPPHRNDS